MPSDSAQVPVSEGSSLHQTVEAGAFRVTRARFPAHGTIPPHTHDRACIAVMLRGSFDLVFPKRTTVACVAGTTVIEPIEDCHCNRMGSRGADVLVIQPDPRAMATVRAFTTLLDGIRAIRRPELRVIAGRLAMEVAHPDAVSPLALEGLSLEFLVTAARAESGTRSHRAVRPLWLARAEDMLRARFAEPLSLADIARECGVHAAHLTRVFRAHFHCSVGEFQRRRRIEWAARALRTSDAPIATIAHDAGFADQSHFTNRFREQMGATPRAWRLLESAASADS